MVKSVMKKKLKKNKEWTMAHPEKVKALEREQNRKGGKYYERAKAHRLVGLPHARVLIRGMHRRIWTQYKQIIAPDSELHHEWIPETADYRGVALVEAKPHQYGIIDVIQILEGEITLLTEAEIRGDK